MQPAEPPKLKVVSSGSTRRNAPLVWVFVFIACAGFWLFAPVQYLAVLRPLTSWGYASCVESVEKEYPRSEITGFETLHKHGTVEKYVFVLTDEQGGKLQQMCAVYDGHAMLQ